MSFVYGFRQEKVCLNARMPIRREWKPQDFHQTANGAPYRANYGVPYYPLHYAPYRDPHHDLTLSLAP